MVLKYILKHEAEEFNILKLRKCPLLVSENDITIFVVLAFKDGYHCTSLVWWPLYKYKYLWDVREQGRGFKSSHMDIYIKLE